MLKKVAVHGLAIPNWVPNRIESCRVPNRRYARLVLRICLCITAMTPAATTAITIAITLAFIVRHVLGSFIFVLVLITVRNSDNVSDSVMIIRVSFVMLQLIAGLVETSADSYTCWCPQRFGLGAFT